MADDSYVAALKRQRAHLKDVGADPGKLAENAELLRLAGVDVDKLDKPEARPSESRQSEKPVGRRAPERQTATAEPKPGPASSKQTAGRKPAQKGTENVSGSGGITLPKPEGKSD